MICPTPAFPPAPAFDSTFPQWLLHTPPSSTYASTRPCFHFGPACTLPCAQSDPHHPISGSSSSLPQDGKTWHPRSQDKPPVPFAPGLAHGGARSPCT